MKRSKEVKPSPRDKRHHEAQNPALFAHIFPPLQTTMETRHRRLSGRQRSGSKSGSRSRSRSLSRRSKSMKREASRKRKMRANTTGTSLVQARIPSISSVSPSILCTDECDTFRIVGENLVSDPKKVVVRLDPISATSAFTPGGRKTGWVKAWRFVRDKTALTQKLLCQNHSL